MSRAFDSKVIEFMKKKKIATMSEIKEVVSTSSSTIVRALKRVGYVSSCNKQSSVYALIGELEFNNDGLCYKKDVMFCEEGSLRKQILKEINSSEAGFATKNIIQKYGKSARNILCQLNVKEEIQNKSLNETRYYFSNDDIIREKQTVERVKIIDVERMENEKIKQDAILFVMGELLKNTTISPKGVQNRLRKIGITISVKDVEEIFSIYELQKIKKKL